MNTSTLPEPTTPAASHAAPPANGRADGASAAALIEFPRPGRAKPPQWRKELSERVREIQQRRALEASRESDDAAVLADVRDGATASGDAAVESSAPQLGLVPQPEPTEVNPIVAKALERIERARRQAPPPYAQQQQQGRATAAAPAQAAASRPEEGRQPAPASSPRAQTPAAAATDAPALESASAEASADIAAEETFEQAAEPVRTTTLVVVPSPPQPAAPSQADASADAAIREALSRPRPRRHIPEVADDALLLRRDSEVAPPQHVPEPEATHGERAPLARRAAASLFDLLVVAFASSPFAAVIELTSGDWRDPRVAACLAGIVLTIAFLYETISVAFSGRTWGMNLFSLRAVDARNGLIPTTGQCARRAVFHILSLAALGLGLLLALFDAQGRTAHDHLSRTVVVKE